MNTALNLLPWRTERRQRRWRHSLLALVFCALAGGMAWWWLDAAADTRLHAQRQHHLTLAQELSALEAKITAFDRHMEQQRAQAITHVRLERERLSFIRLLEQLARDTPDGVILTDVQQHNATLTLTARTASSARIARIVQQWERASAGGPVLSAITSDRPGGAGYTFTLSLPWSAADAAPPIPLAQTEARP